jgi:hypothetical protein
MEVAYVLKEIIEQEKERMFKNVIERAVANGVDIGLVYVPKEDELVSVSILDLEYLREKGR